MKSVCSILGLIILLNFFTQCRQAEKNDAVKKELIVGIPTPFQNNYHPLKNRNLFIFNAVMNSLYSRLFILDEMQKPKPFLVDHYQQNGRKVIFHLKKDLHFSDGSKIRADDVVWSLKEAIKDVDNPFIIYPRITGGKEYNQGKSADCSGIYVIDEMTFAIDFITENTDFPYYFTMIPASILPRHWSEKRMVFSGPFQVEKETVKNQITILSLIPNPYYMGSKAKINRMMFYFYPQDSLFNSDIVKGIPDIFIEVFNFVTPKSNYPYNYFKTPLSGYFFVLLNAKSGIFTDRRLRQFMKNLLLSIDFIKIWNWDYGSPAMMTLPYGILEHQLFKPFKKEDFLTYIPSKPIKVRCYYRDRDIRQVFFTYMKERLKPYNISLELNTGSWEELDPIIKRGDFDMTAFYYLADNPSIVHFYENLIKGGVDINPMTYKISQGLEKLEKYSQEKDDIKKIKILAEIEDMVQNESFIIPIVHLTCLIGYKEHVKNIKVDPFLFIPYEEIEVDEKH